MQTELIHNNLARLGSAFALAMAAGCTTITQPMHSAKDCMVNEVTKSQSSLPFNFSVRSADNYSLACREGRIAAQTTYIGQDAKGNLSPAGALFALQFHKDMQEKIKTSTDSGNENDLKFLKDVVYFFDFYLRSTGGRTITMIEEYVDKLRANSKSPSAAPSRCETRNAIIRSCPPSLPSQNLE